MIITLKPYLDNLKFEEDIKPVEDRRHIPTVKEMAEVSNVSRAQVYNILNNKTRVLNLSIIDKIMKLIRGAGFDISLNDVLKERV